MFKKQIVPVCKSALGTWTGTCSQTWEDDLHKGRITWFCKNHNHVFFLSPKLDYLLLNFSLLFVCVIFVVEKAKAEPPPWWLKVVLCLSTGRLYTIAKTSKHSSPPPSLSLFVCHLFSPSLIFSFLGYSLSVVCSSWYIKQFKFIISLYTFAKFCNTAESASYFTVKGNWKQSKRLYRFIKGNAL